MISREAREAMNLLERLLEFREDYFSNDCLNSEGRKVIEKVFLYLLNNEPLLKKRIAKLRKKPCYEDISRFYEGLRRLFREF
ncbi:MAG: hypothetical protein QXT88_01745 [Desulfurococcaceae archaeon]|uniref:Uncharacterized protein n=1 Tax=Staphylothermus marinus TaxID=2280 RepID=A0A7C4NS74_STAMA